MSSSLNQLSYRGSESPARWHRDVFCIVTKVMHVRWSLHLHKFPIHYHAENQLSTLSFPLAERWSDWVVPCCIACVAWNYSTQIDEYWLMQKNWLEQNLWLKLFWIMSPQCPQRAIICVLWQCWLLQMTEANRILSSIWAWIWKYKSVAFWFFFSERFALNCKGPVWVFPFFIVKEKLCFSQMNLSRKLSFFFNTLRGCSGQSALPCSHRWHFKVSCTVCVHWLSQ